MPTDATTRRVAESVLSKLFGPAVMLTGLALIVHLARPSTGTMFDDDNVGATVVLGLVGVLVIVAGGFMTRSSMRTIRLEGPCPSCAAVAVRAFDKPTDPTSAPSACGACTAYLRASDNALREEAIDASDMIYRNYVLAADQYQPAIKPTNRGYFRFEMPTMCAVCGDPNAPHKRKIGNGDALGSDPIEALTKGHVLPQAGMTPGRSKPSEEDENSRGLSHLTAPVCDKHTEDAAISGEALEYRSGKLEFASYRYYKAFCELNHITRASTKRRG